MILINETLARTYFGTANPIGVEMNRGRIVGIVGDVRQVELNRPSVPEIYFPMAQNWSQVADLGMTLVVRSSASPAKVVDSVRSRVLDVNPRIAIFNIRTMEQFVDDSLRNLNLYRWLMSWFAAVTLVLSAVGLYGVVSHGVIARRREWGVRLALGSAPSQIAVLVLRRGLVLAAAGIAVGALLVAVIVRSLGAELPAAAHARAPMFAAVALILFGSPSARRGCRRAAWRARRRRAR